MKRAPILKILIPVVTLLTGLTGCGKDFVTDKVEQRIEAVLPTYIGPAAAYHAKVDGSLGGMMKGRLHSLHIEGDQVQFTPELTIDLLQIEMQGVEFDTKQNALKKVEATRISGEITSDSIERYLSKTNPSISDLSIEIKKDELQVKARPKVMGLSPNVEATGKLVMNGSTKVNFEPTHVKLGGIPAPKQIADLIVKQINPVLDLSKYDYPIQLSDIRMQPGKLVVTGTADISSKLMAPSQEVAK